jgi:hypothetical protein
MDWIASSSVVLLAMTPRPAMHWLKRAWQGEERLWKVFWIYVILAGGILDAIQQAGFSFLIKPNVHLSPLQVPPWAIIVVGLWMVFSILYIIWLSRALWKCSFNTRWRILGYAARIVFVLGLTDVSFDMTSLKDSAEEMTSGAALVRCAGKTAGGVDNGESVFQNILEHSAEIQKCMESSGNHGEGSN